MEKHNNHIAQSSILHSIKFVIEVILLVNFTITYKQMAKTNLIEGVFEVDRLKQYFFVKHIAIIFNFFKRHLLQC